MPDSRRRRHRSDTALRADRRRLLDPTASAGRDRRPSAARATRRACATTRIKAVAAVCDCTQTPMPLPPTARGRRPSLRSHRAGTRTVDRAAAFAIRAERGRRESRQRRELRQLRGGRQDTRAAASASRWDSGSASDSRRVIRRRDRRIEMVRAEHRLHREIGKAERVAFPAERDHATVRPPETPADRRTQRSKSLCCRRSAG